MSKSVQIDLTDVLSKLKKVCHIILLCYRCYVIPCYVMLCYADVDECVTLSPCNYGTCTNIVGSYTCDCTGSGYGGTNCDIGTFMLFVFSPFCVPFESLLFPY